MKNIKENIEDFNGSTALVRCNFDVPIKSGKVADATRIQDALETINILLENNCKVVLAAHLGRPKGNYSKQLSFEPIKDQLQSFLNKPIHFIDYHQLSKGFPETLNHPITLYDNIRFWPQEEKNDPLFAKQLAQGTQNFVNESFATSHREHASIVGVTQHLTGYIGTSFSREIETLDQILDHPKKPLTLVMGGAKLKTKEPLITTFRDKADHILIGGKLALDLKDHPLTNLPQLLVADLVESQKDITVASANNFADIILNSGTVIWNGSMGVFEEKEHRQGTTIVANAINQTSAYTLVGGGDTESALSVLDAEEGIDHISSGGGAMLVYLSTGKLVGLTALK